MIKDICKENPFGVDYDVEYKFLTKEGLFFNGQVESSASRMKEPFDNIGGIDIVYNAYEFESGILAFQIEKDGDYFMSHGTIFNNNKTNRAKINVLKDKVEFMERLQESISNSLKQKYHD